MKGIIVLFIILGFSLDVEAKSPGRAGATFLKMGLGTKSRAMGESFCALADDPATIYYNPAGLAHFDQREVTFTHISWFQKINSEDLTYLAPLQELDFKIPGVFATNLVYLGINDIQEYGETKDSYLGSFDAYNLLLDLSYARLINPTISVGLNLKHINQKIKSSSSAFLIDLGLLSKTVIKNLNLGVTLQNIALLNNFRDNLPFNIKLGSSYKLLKDNLLTLALDMDIPSDSDRKLHLGVEYLYSIEDIKIAMRLGYKTGLDDSKLGFGFGVTFDKYKFDYAYSSYNDLGNVNQLSLDLKFDKIKPLPITSGPKIEQTLPVLSRSTPLDSKTNVVFESKGEDVTEVIDFEEVESEPHPPKKPIVQPLKEKKIEEDKEKKLIQPSVSEEEVKAEIPSLGDEEENKVEDKNYSKAKVTIWR